jgi:hypothetical protein
MSNSDSSEIITHVRTVHFFLVVSCILPIISFLAGLPSKVKTAYEQLQDVISIKDDLNLWVRRFGIEQITWLQANNLSWPDTIAKQFYILQDELARNNLPRKNMAWILTPLHSPLYLYILVNYPSGSRYEILGYSEGGQTKGSTGFSAGRYALQDSDNAAGPPQLKTPENFHYLWNTANTVIASIVTEFSDVAYLVANHRFPTNYRFGCALLTALLLVALASPSLASQAVRCQTHHERTRNRLMTLCDDGTWVGTTWNPTLQRWQTTVTPPHRMGAQGTFLYA